MLRVGDETEMAGAVSIRRPKVDQDSLREQMLRAITASLVTGEMRPGVMYSVPALAERYGVSATPVREALLDLTRQGFFEPVRNRGFLVTETSEVDLDHVAELRKLLEVPSVGRIAVLADRADVLALKPLAIAIEKAAAAREVTSYLEADTRFHLALLGLLGNQHLVEIVAQLRNQARLYGLIPLIQQGQLATSAREHRLLLRAVADADASGARKLMAHHLTLTRGLWAGR
ncbi:GntR family transcriptional regulator [Candidatus Aeolococcus gillhamiae]